MTAFVPSQNKAFEIQELEVQIDEVLRRRDFKKAVEVGRVMGQAYVFPALFFVCFFRIIRECKVHYQLLKPTIALLS